MGKHARPDVIQWYKEQKAESCCVVCGIQHPAVIEFHHKNPKDKRDTISNMVHAGKKMTEILEEFEKTEATCKNCHAIEHWDYVDGKRKRFGSSMLRLVE